MTNVSISSSGGLKVPVDGPLVLDATEHLDAILRTPAQFGGTDTLVQIYPRLTDDSLKYIWEARKVRLDLDDFLLNLEFHYAAIAHPELGGVWPSLRRGIILDEIFVDCPPVTSIKTLINGQRFAFTVTDGVEQRLSFEEFADYFQMTVGDHLRRTAAIKISRLQRALDLVKQTKPIIYDIGVSDGEQCGRRDVVAYTEDQVRSYARQNKLHLLEMHAYDAVFKSGEFRRGEPHGA